MPSETPDNTPMVNGPVRAFAQVGANVWAGGNFSEVRRRDGSLVDRVGGLAVFDSATGGYVPGVAPALGGNVRDVAAYGDYVLIAGSFSGPSGTQKNLVALDAKTGAVVKWYNAPALQSVAAAPGLGRVYGGGVALSAFDFEGGKRLWERAKTIVDPDSSTIWGACACDWVEGPDGAANPAKALVKLSTEGAHDPSYSPERAGVGAFGISVAHDSRTVYLGAGGNDFLAAYSKADGRQAWRRDTSGSAQAVEIMGNQLVVGGHFWEIADQSTDRCGGRSDNNDVTLEPFGDECQTRHGLAAYSTAEGTLDPDWSPMLEGKYNLAWALHPEVDPGSGTPTGRLHVGGEFLTVDGVRQTNYAKLSEPGFADTVAPVTRAPEHALTAAGSAVNTSTVPVKASWSAADDRGAVARYELQQSTDGGASYANIGLSAPTSTTKTLPLAPESGYRLRVRATDDAGNTSAWAEGAPFTVDAHQQPSAGVLEYSGTWAEDALATAFGGSTTHSSQAGATATLTFTGTDVSWVMQRGPDRGRAEVWLDGTKIETVDLYATSAQPRRVAYNAASLDASVEHTLEVRVLGTKRAASTGTRADVDAFVALR